ncbi:MAG: maleylacetoacetate isomerase [Burkholderiaceae bacterium]
MLTLHSYHLSLATYRVRIALRLKKVAFRELTYDLARGDHLQPGYRALNPAGAVPALEGATKKPLTQSLAILEWLEETYPTPSLMPSDAEGRARVRTLFLLTAADTHPIIVPRVRKQLVQRFGADDTAIASWAAHWLDEGLIAYEATLEDGATRCYGETLTIADLGLASHLLGCARFDVDLAPYPRVRAIGASLDRIPEVAASHPGLQIDAPVT